MAVASCNFSPAKYSLFSSSSSIICQPIIYTSNPNSIKPIINFKENNPIRFSKLRISHRAHVKPAHALRVSAILGLGNYDSDAYPELESSSSDSTDSSSTEATTIDLKLPRRRLSILFTCDACGHRTQRLINRLAYERGTVFVQCAGCLQHHKLVDNLGLVVEYDLREDAGTDGDTC